MRRLWGDAGDMGRVIALAESGLDKFSTFLLSHVPVGTTSTLRARVETLERALEPFAAHDRALGKSYGPFRLYDETGYREMPREELRAARAALQPAAAPERLMREEIADAILAIKLG